MKKTLEEILQEYFDCEKPFLDEPYYDKEECAPFTLTDEGAKAYVNLIGLLYSVGNLTGRSVNAIVDQLDEICSEI